ncbi:hypothetical protein ABN09_08525, partial [Morganella morganii]
DSVAECAARKCIAVLLTGMGMDGARGMLNLRQKGAVTYAQDERSCVVFGMPRAAIELNAVDEIQDLVKICPQCAGQTCCRFRLTEPAIIHCIYSLYYCRSGYGR